LVGSYDNKPCNKSVKEDLEESTLRDTISYIKNNYRSLQAQGLLIRKALGTITNLQMTKLLYCIDALP